MFGDTRHEIASDVKLKGGATLHRFKNAGDVSYSAIYVDGLEEASSVREHEKAMVEWWNEEHVAR